MSERNVKLIPWFLGTVVLKRYGRKIVSDSLVSKDVLSEEKGIQSVSLTHAYSSSLDFRWDERMRMWMFAFDNASERHSSRVCLSVVRRPIGARGVLEASQTGMGPPIQFAKINMWSSIWSRSSE